MSANPFSTPSAVPVPISHPKYEFKTRLNRKVTVTDTSASEPDNGRSPGDALIHRSTETLSVRQGPLTYTEAIEYRSFACYKHGSKQVYTQSVGYSSDRDLVLMRNEISVASDRDEPSQSLRRKYIGLDSATCLNPRATPSGRAVLDADADPQRWSENRIARMRKYPGVRCPKNRKTRNRLLNDHFVAVNARKLCDSGDSDPEGFRRPAAPCFDTIPQHTAAWLLHGSDALRNAEMERLGLDEALLATGAKKPRVFPPRHIDSASFRFSQLNARLKSELHHAMTTDFMPGHIADLESRFAMLIRDAEAGAERRELSIQCRDGYGRLMTHAVAAFYKLISESRDNAEGERETLVKVPKRPFPLPQQSLLAFLRGERSPTQAPQAQPNLSRRPLNFDQVDPRDQDSDSNDEARLSRKLRFRKRVLKRHHRAPANPPLATIEQL